MPWLLIVVIASTLAVSFVCSLFEAIVLSMTVAEIEAVKKKKANRGRRLETMKNEMDDTISSILALNTIGNVLGSIAIGAIASHYLDEKALLGLTAGFGFVLLVGSEVLPKNIGVTQRTKLLPLVAYPLWTLRRVMTPISWLCNIIIRPFIKTRAKLHRSDEEILLLAERGAAQGTLTRSESSIIANALSLDDVRVNSIMTPRSVVSALQRSASVGEVFRENPNLPFGRIVVYGKSLDDVVGLVRRRDLLKAKANDQDSTTVEQMMGEVQFVPETVTVASALQTFLRTHQQLVVVVDEFGATAGVLSMEDVIEHLLGREIFEKDDVAVDMREFARAKLQKGSKKKPVTGAPGA